MSYGQNLPWGLQATRTLGASTWNGQTNPYLIQSGYPNNIFKGDPVIIAGPGDSNGAQAGYIISIYDADADGQAFLTTPTVGIFDGCSYVTPTATNPIDPASPGRQYWPQSTTTLNGVPAVAYVIDDPNTVFNIQSQLNSSLGVVQAQVGATFSYLFQLDSTDTYVQGNFLTGQSSVALVEAPTDTSRGEGSNLNNMLCLAIVPTPPNPTVQGTQYNNVEVLIQNHAFVTRPQART